MNSSITAFVPMWARCSAWPALQAATPPLLLVAIVGVVLVNPQGIPAHQLAHLVEADSRVALGVLLGWTLLMGPAARASVFSPGLRYLRWLPMPSSGPRVFLGITMIVLHLPVGLFLLGAGSPLTGTSLCLGGAGLSACLLLPRYQRADWVFPLLWMAGIFAAILLRRPWVLTGVGILALGQQVPWSWRHAAKPSSRHRKQLLFGGPRLALALALALRLWRVESLLLRYSLLLVAQLGFSQLVVSQDPGSTAETLPVLLVASTPGLAASALILSRALCQAEAELHWLAASLSITSARLARASLAVLLLSAGVFATLLVAVTGSYDLFLAMPLLGHAFFWAMAATLLTRGQPASSARPALWSFSLALGNMVLLGMLGPWLVLLVLSLASILWIRSTHA